MQIVCYSNQERKDRVASVQGTLESLRMSSCRTTVNGSIGTLLDFEERMYSKKNF